MDTEELTPAERLRFAKYLEKKALTCRRGAGVIAAVFKNYDADPTRLVSITNSKAMVRKLNAKAIACDVVVRELKHPDAGPSVVKPGGDQPATERPFDWVERGGDVVEKDGAET